VLGKHLNALEYFDGYSYCSVTKEMHKPVLSANQNDHLLLLEVTTDDISEFLASVPEFEDSLMSSNEK
jgi:hypothetical protein